MRINKEKLRIVMARKCVNAGDLVRATGMPRPTVSKALSGQSISTKTIGLISAALDVDVTEIIE